MGAATDQAMRSTLTAILAALRSSPQFEEVAANTAGPVLDLTTKGQGYCRRIMPLADGTIVVRERGDGTEAGSDVLRTLTVKASIEEPIEATALVSNSGAVKVYW